MAAREGDVMKKIILYISFVALIAFLASPSEAANKFWWASCRTGGGDCLDGIDGASLTAGDGALVALDSGSTTPEVYFYRVYASSASESDPLVIAPDTNPGTLRWHLINIYGASINSVAADGARRIDVLINGTRTPASGKAELYPEGNSTDSRWKMSNQISSSTTEDTVVGIATADTLTNKTLPLGSNDLTAVPHDININILGPDSGDIVWVKLQRAMTASSLGCRVEGGTSMILTVQECDSAYANCSSILGATLTCATTATEANLSDTSWASGATLKFTCSTESGTVNTLHIYGTGTETW